VRVAATQDISPSYAEGSEPPVGRSLVLIGVAATIVVAAVVGAGRYGWLLLHQSTRNFLWPFSGWQVDVVKALIGCAFAAVAIGATFATRRVNRSLAGRTPHARAVVLAALIPGILIGAQVIGPINSALGWASDHSTQAAAIHARQRQQYIHDLTAPPQMASQLPAAPRALARLLLTSSALGADWYDTQRPATTENQIFPVLAKQGAQRAASTTLTHAHRGSASWVTNLLVLERVTTFDTAKQAARYAAAYRRQSAKPCNCLVSIVIDQVRLATLHGVAVQSWRDRLGADVNRNAAFSRGTDAFTLYVGRGMSTIPSYSELMTVLRQAVTRSGRTT
jgi:hypothetical protein